MAKIIAITNQKGGVGKTTTSVNLSASLGVMGKKVLLVDLDPQGNATGGMGLNKSELAKSVYDILVNDAEAKDVLQATEFAVDILPANIELAGAEVELVTTISRETRLKRALEEIRENYDFIFIDCPPSLGLLTLNALAAADAVLMPIQCEFYALEGVLQLLKTIELVQNNLNPELYVDGVVLTMYDGRIKLAEQVVEEVKKNFTDVTYDTVIPRNVRLSEAPSYGKPITAYDKKSKGALSYMQLAEEVVNRGN